VSFYGSSQVGYIVLDPATGAGAYKIGGGENGGELLIGLATADLVLGILGNIVDGTVSLLTNSKSPVYKVLFALGKFLGLVGFATKVTTSLLKGCNPFALISLMIFAGVLVGIATGIGTAVAGPVGGFVLGRLASFAMDRLLVMISPENC